MLALLTCIHTLQVLKQLPSGQSAKLMQYVFVGSILYPLGHRHLKLPKVFIQVPGGEHIPS